MLPALLALVLQQQIVQMHIKVTIPVDPPVAPVAVVAHRRKLLVLSEPCVQLVWRKSDDLKTPPQAGAGYRVYKAVGTGAFAVLQSGMQTVTLTDKGVKKGQKYRYYVTALIGQVESKPTATVEVSP